MQIFISYSSKDIDIVKKYREQFLTNNINVWMAPYSIPYGENYLTSIPEGLMSSDIIVVFISSNSMSSEWVEKELENASKFSKTIVPIYLENVRMTPTFEFLLSKCQSIKYSSKSLDPNANLSGFIKQIHSYNKQPTTIVDEYNVSFLKHFENLNIVFSNLKYTFFKQNKISSQNLDLDSLVLMHSKVENDFNANNLIKNNDNYFVTGGAGSGKSTLVKKTLFDVCRNAISSNHKVVPIYINLPRLENSKKIDEQILFESFNELMIKKIDFNHFHELLKEYKFVIAFDGLDEYSLEDNQIKINLFNDIKNLTSKINCSIIVGCRNINFINDNNFLVVKLNPMSPSQAEQFIDKYLSYFSVNISAHDFYNKLPSEISHDMLTPLLLSIVIAIYMQTNEIPNTLDKLYNQYIRKLLSYVNDNLDAINESFLGACKIAFEMLIKGTTSLKKSAASQIVSKSIVSTLIYSGLLTLNNDDLMFIHSTFMEYLAHLESSKNYGFIPKDTMDQYFLQDPKIINKIIFAADIKPDDILLELGAGIGSVASHYPLCKQIILDDLDPNLCKILRYNFKNSSNISIIEQDAIKALTEVKFNKLITNLPFFLTKDILKSLTKIKFDIAIMSVKSDEKFDEFSEYFNIVELTKVDGSCFYPKQPFSSKIIFVTLKH